jgi:transposase
MKTCSRAHRTSDWGEGSPSNRTPALSNTAQEWLRDNSLDVFEWPSQSPDLNPIKHLWRDLKITVQQHSPSNLTKLEMICREEWEKRPKYRCAMPDTQEDSRL